MAYVLGFFVADGSIYTNPRGAHYLDFHITDKELLIKIRRLLKSNHKISLRKKSNPKWKQQYRLQIGSKEMFRDLMKLGTTPRKSKTQSLPKIPDKYFQHFLRGYFDGDGFVHFGRHKRTDRKSLKTVLLVGFSSGSKDILESIAKSLKKLVKLKGGTYYRASNSHWLTYSIKDSLKLYYFMYDNIRNNCYLKRKLKIFQRAIKYFEER